MSFAPIASTALQQQLAISRRLPEKNIHWQVPLTCVFMLRLIRRNFKFSRLNAGCNCPIYGSLRCTANYKRGYQWDDCEYCFLKLGKDWYSAFVTKLILSEYITNGVQKCPKYTNPKTNIVGSQKKNWNALKRRKFCQHPRKAVVSTSDRNGDTLL